MSVFNPLMRHQRPDFGALCLQMYALFSAEHQRALAAVYLPAARRGLGLGAGRTQAPLLMRFITQLLQVCLCCQAFAFAVRLAPPMCAIHACMVACGCCTFDSVRGVPALPAGCACNRDSAASSRSVFPAAHLASLFLQGLPRAERR